MLHAYVRKFDVISTVENFLGTKHPLNVLAQTSVSCSISQKHKNDSCSESLAALASMRP